jgi:3-deoxy-D-manno-octulosonic-acid transferase
LLMALANLGIDGFGSVGTATGHEVLRRVAPSIPSSLAPIDHPVSVTRALTRVKPRALVLIEGEFWPSLILIAKRRGVSVWVASGRLSDRSFAHYRRLRWLIRPIMNRFDGVAARSQMDADRFSFLGVRPERLCVLGDLKLDPPRSSAHLATDLVRATSSVSIFVAGSTHPSEEQAVLEVLEACQRHGHEVALVIAPRHLERLGDVVRTVEAMGRPLYLRSELSGQRLANGDVLVLDSIGELPALYAAATIAFVGGTLADVGGHNLLEPLFEGCPVVFGPSLRNVRESAAIAEETGAGFPVESAADLAEAVAALMNDPKDCRARGYAAKRFLESHRGSANRVATWLRDGLGDGPADANLATGEHDTS